MHFRDRGRSIQLVRTTYDAEAKKPTTEVVGSLVRPKLELADDVRSKLSAEELTEVTGYIERMSRSSAIEREYAVINFKTSIDKVAAWLALANDAEASAFVEDVQKPLTKLRRDMLKRATADGEETAKKSPGKTKA